MSSTAVAPLHGRKSAFVSRSEFEPGTMPVSDPDIIVWDEEAQPAVDRYLQAMIGFDQNLTLGSDPDAVVMDVQLPALSGLETLKYLRANPGGLPIIMMSGRSAEINELVSAVASRRMRSGTSAIGGPARPSSSTAQTIVEKSFDFDVVFSMETQQRRTSCFLALRRMLSKTEIDSAHTTSLWLDVPRSDLRGWQTTETIRTSLNRLDWHAFLQPDLTTKVAYRLAQVSEMERAPDSIMPDQEVINAAVRVIGYLPATTRMPQIEIDDSNGAISLVWRDSDDQNTFALEIPNSRCVVGVGFGEGFSNFKPWRFLISEERKIVGAMQASEPAKKLLSDA